MVSIYFLLCLLVFANAQNTFINNLQQSPQSISSDLPVTFFSVSNPTANNPTFSGPQVLISSGQVDVTKGTITLPLYRGTVTSGSNSSGEPVWFVLTDTSDQQTANTFGINWSPKLALLQGHSGALRTATIGVDGTFVFESGTVDFSGNRVVPVPTTANETVFSLPIPGATPGAIGDSNYSPYVTVTNKNWVFNAPIVAMGTTEAELNTFCEGVSSNDSFTNIHDRVVAICPRDKTVTLKMTLGFAMGRPIWYLGMDASDLSIAALENATFVPALKGLDLGGCGLAASETFCSSDVSFQVINGPTNREFAQITNNPNAINPFRQGIISELFEEGSSLAILPEIPTFSLGYTPFLELLLVEWTQQAIDFNIRTRIENEFDLLGFVKGGWITGMNGQPLSSSGIFWNAPIAYRFI